MKSKKCLLSLVLTTFVAVLIAMPAVGDEGTTVKKRKRRPNSTVVVVKPKPQPEPPVEPPVTPPVEPPVVPPVVPPVEPPVVDNPPTEQIIKVIKDEESPIFADGQLKFRMGLENEDCGNHYKMDVTVDSAVLKESLAGEKTTNGDVVVEKSTVDLYVVPFSVTFAVGLNDLSETDIEALKASLARIALREVVTVSVDLVSYVYEKLDFGIAEYSGIDFGTVRVDKIVDVTDDGFIKFKFDVYASFGLGKLKNNSWYDESDFPEQEKNANTPLTVSTGGSVALVVSDVAFETFGGAKYFVDPVTEGAGSELFQWFVGAGIAYSPVDYLSLGVEGQYEDFHQLFNQNDSWSQSLFKGDLASAYLVVKYSW